MIHVIAKIQVQPGQRQRFLAEFHRLVPLVQAEAGCREYGPAVDAETSLAAQRIVGEDVVVVIEKWDSLAALEAHLTAAHMVDFRTRVQELVIGTTLEVLQNA